jgi:hypothetical protein
VYYTQKELNGQPFCFDNHRPALIAALAAAVEYMPGQVNAMVCGPSPK